MTTATKKRLAKAGDAVIKAACKWHETHERLMAALLSDGPDATQVQIAQFQHSGARMRLEDRVRKYTRIRGEL